MTRTLTIPLRDVLDLVVSAEDYGFSRDILMFSLYEFAKPVTDAEIAEFAASFLAAEMLEQGYGQEDADEATERVTQWRDKYAAIEAAREAKK